MTAVEELARRFSAFGLESSRRAPLYSVLSGGVAADASAVELMLHAPEEQHSPVLLFAAVHYLLLDGHEHELGEFYPNLTPNHRSPESAYPVFRRFIDKHADELISLLATRNTQTNEVGRCAFFLPPLGMLDAEVGPLAIVDIGTSAGLNQLLTRYSYDYKPGGKVGEHSSVHLECDVRGELALPARLPIVTATIGLDAAPVDVLDLDAVRWLEACVWPDQLERFTRLQAAIELARDTPPTVRQGDAIDDLADTVLAIADQGHPVVLNSWVLSYLSEDRQRAYVTELDRLGSERDLSWVVAESPGQTPGLPIPTTAEPEQITVLSLVTWRGGKRVVRRLGTCHPHGLRIHAE